MTDRIIQIIPAPPDMWAKWEPDKVCSKVEYSRIVCLAHVADEQYDDIVPMVICEDGGISNVFDFSNFGGIVFAKYPYKEATDGN